MRWIKNDEKRGLQNKTRLIRTGWTRPEQDEMREMEKGELV